MTAVLVFAFAAILRPSTLLSCVRLGHDGGVDGLFLWVESRIISNGERISSAIIAPAFLVYFDVYSMVSFPR